MLWYPAYYKIIVHVPAEDPKREQTMDFKMCLSLHKVLW